MKKNKVLEIILPEFKTYYKVSVVNILVLVKNKHTDQGHRTDNPEIDPHALGQLNCNRDTRAIQ